MVSETKLYDILSITPSASPEEITRSYRKIALKCHPDKTNHDPTLTEQFKRVTRAYEVLKDSNTRKIYDVYGEAGLEGNVAPPQNKRQASFTHRSATDVFTQVFSDINNVFGSSSMNHNFGLFSMGNNMFEMGMGFNMNMGSDKNMKKTVRPAPPADGRDSRKVYKGKDIYHTCKLLLDDLAYGKVLKLQLPRKTKCDSCNGEGGFQKASCRTCQGSGRVVTTMKNYCTLYQSVGLCASCSGVGFTYSEVCGDCQDGYKVMNKLIHLRIPPGTKDGDQIVLKGSADEGRNIIPGDVVIKIRQIRHEYLIRKDNDLYMEYDIDLRTSLLGGYITIKDFLKKGNDLRILINVHGNQSLNNSVNSSIQNGEILGTINSGAPKIVKGLGMPINTEHIDGVFYQTDDTVISLDISQYSRGNLFIKFNVQIPPINHFNPEQLSALTGILPTTQETHNTRTDFTEVHLSNLPDYSGTPPFTSPHKQSSISSEDIIDVDSEEFSRKRKGT